MADSFLREGKMEEEEGSIGKETVYQNKPPRWMKIQEEMKGKVTCRSWGPPRGGRVLLWLLQLGGWLVGI